MPAKFRNWQIVTGVILALFVTWILLMFFAPDWYDSLPSLWDLQNPRMWGRIFNR